MTPTGIKLGRQFDSTIQGIDVTNSGAIKIAPGDSNRVALAAALGGLLVSELDATVMIGPKVNGFVVALTTLSAGHPVCYLSVDKVGSVLFSELFVQTDASATFVLGVTIVRQVQELP